MFEMLNEDLEDCLEILRQISTCESRNEQLMILAEQRIDEDDIKKTIELCEMMVYYHNRTKHG
jgi:hypothetical protein